MFYLLSVLEYNICKTSKEWNAVVTVMICTLIHQRLSSSHFSGENLHIFQITIGTAFVTATLMRNLLIQLTLSYYGYAMLMIQTKLQPILFRFLQLLNNKIYQLLLPVDSIVKSQCNAGSLSGFFCIHNEE